MASVNYQADRAHRLQRNNVYPIQIWYLLATLILLVAVVQAVSRLHTKFAGRKRRGTDQESNSPANSSSPHPRRIPLAILSTYRVIAFRWTLNINIGQTYTLNVAEMFFTIVYIIAIFTWTFINSESSLFVAFSLPEPIVPQCSNNNFRQETRFHLLVEPYWCYCCQSVPLDHCVGDEE
jgi:hypothetical protein